MTDPSDNILNGADSNSDSNELCQSSDVLLSQSDLEMVIASPCITGALGMPQALVLASNLEDIAALYHAGNRRSPSATPVCVISPVSLIEN